MKKIAFVVYRNWAYQIFNNILTFQKENSGFFVSALITNKKAEFSTEKLTDFENIYVVEENDEDEILSILSKNKIIC